jgi:hypothetical protein
MLPVEITAHPLSDVLLEPCSQLDLQEFVERFSACIVQERDLAGRSSMDFRLIRLADFYAANRSSCASWSSDDYGSAYVFHDLCTNAGSVGEFDALLDECPPADWFVTLSETSPCVRVTIALGGRNSFTSLHSHGAAGCLLLAGEKEWWLWPPEISPLLSWLAAGMRVRNRLALWDEAIAPALERARGDGRDEFFGALEELASAGQFVAASDHPAHARTMEFRDERGRPLTAQRLLGRRVTQHAGEALYFPQAWSHAVRNSEWHVALVYELRFEPGQ